jgi:hypothetical protein
MICAGKKDAASSLWKRQCSAKAPNPEGTTAVGGVFLHKSAQFLTKTFAFL